MKTKRWTNPRRVFPELQLHSTGNRNLWSRARRDGCASTLHLQLSPCKLRQGRPKPSPSIEERQSGLLAAALFLQEAESEAHTPRVSFPAPRGNGRGAQGSSHAQPYLSDHFLFLHKPKREGVEERGRKSLPPGGAVAKPPRLFAPRPVSEWQPREGGGVPLDRDFSCLPFARVSSFLFSSSLRLSPARLLRSSLPYLSQMAEGSSTPECLR